MISRAATSLLPPAVAPLAAPSPRDEGNPRWLVAVWMLAIVATAAMAVTVEIGATLAGLLVGSIFFLGGAAVVRASVREDTRFAIHLFTGAFLARYVAAIIVLVAMNVAGVTELKGGSDYVTFEAAGWYLAENWRSGNFVFLVVDKDPGYFYLVASVYALIGRYIIAPTLLNALFGGFTAVLVFLLGRELFGRRAGALAGVLAAFLPTLLFWSSMLYKDTVLACAVTWACYLGVRIAHERTRAEVWWLGVSFIPIFMMRPETGVTLGAALGALILWKSGMSVGRIVSVGAAMATVLLLLLGFEVLGLGGRSTLDRFANPLTAVFSHREAWADQVGVQATGFSRALYGRNLLLSPHLLVVATALPFLLPIPGTFSLGMNFSTFLLPGQIVWLSLLPALGYGSWLTLRRRSPMSLVLLLFAVGSAIGVALAGYFANPRYLVQVVPLLLVFAAVGLLEVRRVWPRYAGFVCLAVALVIAYALFRG